jgi:3-deoxy-D-manno-octulosonic-acid transferase
MKFIYNSIVLLAQLLLPIIALFNKKMQLFVSGRKETFTKLAQLQNEKTIWFHASSLGEFEQAIPILELLKKQYQHHKILVTFFSPSGYEVRKNYPLADVVCYLPLDSTSNAKQFVKMVNISVAVFIKYEFWPNFLHQLQKNKIPTLLVSGIFRKQQVFFKSYGGFMRKALQSFNHFFVQDKNSKNLLESIHYTNVTVAGDTRFDRVSKIVNQNNELHFIKDFIDGKFTFVAGSSWLDDETIITNYINTKATENEKFIFAPHNIKLEEIKRLQKSIQKKSILYSELRQAQSDESKNSFDEDLKEYQVLIIDTIGFLTKIYSYADVAYVGGGLKTGLHNILEPATFGIPVIIGNHYDKFKEARDLVKEKGCFSIENQNDFDNIYTKLKIETSFREETGKTNANYVKENKGATDKVIEHINKIINIR